MPTKTPKVLCRRCRLPFPEKDLQDEICLICIKKAQDAAFRDQRSEFYDRRFNTLTVRLFESEGWWIARIEYAKRGCEPVAGCESTLPDREAGAAKFAELLASVTKDSGWKAVDPRWDLRLIRSPEPEQLQEAS